MPGRPVVRWIGAWLLAVATPALGQNQPPAEGAPSTPGEEAAGTQAPQVGGSGTGSASTGADPDTVVARVNGTDITLGHMIVLGERLPQQYQDLEAQVLFDGVLDQLVQQAALGARLDGEPGPRVAYVLDNERRALIATEVLEAAAEEAVTEEAVQATYTESYGGAEPVTEYNASHILVEDRDEAASLAEEARSDDADFAELARDNSTGPSGPNGGNLGWFSAGMMVEPFQNAVAELEPGAISDPVETQFGWHVIKLNDVREREAPGLEQVRSEIEAQLRQEAIQSEIEAATEAADIERMDTSGIDAAAIRDGSLLAD